MEHGSGSYRTLNRDLGIVTVYNRFYDRQADTGALALGGEAGDENRGACLGGNGRAVIAHV